MSPLIGVIIVLGLALGIVALVVWKVLKGPTAPPKQPGLPELRDESQTSPLFDTSTSNELGPTRLDVEPGARSNPVPPPEPRPPEPVRSAAPPESVHPDAPSAGPDLPKSSFEVTPKMVATAAAFAISPGLTVAYLAGRALEKSMNPAKMSGGDECLGYNRKSLQHKDRAIPILSIEVYASGKVSADGQEVSIPELEARLAGLKAQGGQVHYYSESAGPQPPQAEQALGVVLGSGIPVSFVSGKE